MDSHVPPPAVEGDPRLGGVLLQLVVGAGPEGVGAHLGEEGEVVLGEEQEVVVGEELEVVVVVVGEEVVEGMGLEEVVEGEEL